MYDLETFITFYSRITLKDDLIILYTHVYELRRNRIM